MIVEITLISFFLGTSMEKSVFDNALNLINTTSLIVVKKNNQFYFKSKKDNSKISSIFYSWEFD